MTTTVFGGTGFLGRAVVRALVAQGMAVRVASRHAPAELPAGAEHVAADVRADADVRTAVAGAAIVVNAVALYVESDAVSFEEVHVAGAARLARAARRAGAERLVHVSGIGADAHSRSRYVAARGRGEEAARDAFPDADVLRPGVLFGPGDAFLRTLERVTRLPVIPLFGNGGMRLQPVHVDDVAAAVAALARASTVTPALCELGGAEVLRYRAIVERVLRHLGRRRLLVPVPFAVWHVLAGAASVLPSPPLTRDQLVLMATDNVARGPGFADLGIEPRGLGEALAECLPRVPVHPA